MNITAFSMFFLQAEVALDSTEESESLINVLQQSGILTIVIVSILLLLSIIAIYIYVERWFTIKRAARVDQNFMNNIRASVQAGNLPGASALCQQENSPASRLIEKGLQRIGKPLREIDAAIENVGNLELFKLEKGLSTLASIAGAAPMIGFFGTVTGMITAFYKMSTEQNISPDVLAGGIYQALLTTAFGLFIGILAYVGYNILVANVEKVVYKMERTTVEFMDLLQEPAR